MVGIVIGSTFKGVLAGVAAGIFARKVNSVPLGVLFGLFIGFLLAWGVAAMQGDHYLAIILPGSINLGRGSFSPGTDLFILKFPSATVRAPSPSTRPSFTGNSKAGKAVLNPTG